MAERTTTRPRAADPDSTPESPDTYETRLQAVEERAARIEDKLGLVDTSLCGVYRYTAADKQYCTAADRRYSALVDRIRGLVLRLDEPLATHMDRLVFELDETVGERLFEHMDRAKRGAAPEINDEAGPSDDEPA